MAANPSRRCRRRPAEAVLTDRLGWRSAGSTSSRRLRGPPVRRRPRLHRRLRLRRLLAAGLRSRRRRPMPWAACSSSPSRCPPGPGGERATGGPGRSRATSRSSSSRPTSSGRWPTCSRPSPRPSGCSIGQAPSRLVLPGAASYVVFLIDGLGAELLRRHAHAAPFLSSLLVEQEVATAGVPSTTATSLTSLGTGLPPGAHGLVGFTSRIPGTDQLLNALLWNKYGRPDPVAAPPDGLRAAGRDRGQRDQRQQARVPGQRADRRRAARRGVRRRRPGGRADRRRASPPRRRGRR